MKSLEVAALRNFSLRRITISLNSIVRYFSSQLNKDPKEELFLLPQRTNFLRVTNIFKI